MKPEYSNAASVALYNINKSIQPITTTDEAQTTSNINYRAIAKNNIKSYHESYELIHKDLQLQLQKYK